ncbi:MAG: peptidoglycan DD-metalloendopeptidase family protein [bacterium]|nr:peptidoglycan DD-metalloendopeptidase family protein [bacterium]
MTIKTKNRSQKTEYRRQKLIFFFILIIFFFFYHNSFCFNIQTREFDKQIIKEEKHLRKIKEDIQKKTKTIGKLKREEETIISQLDGIKKELAESKNNLWHLEKNINAKNIEIKKTEKKIVEASYKLNVYSKDLSCLLENMYKYKNRGYLEYIISAENLCDFIRRYKFLTILATSYAQLVKNIDYQKKIIINENNILNNSFKKLKSLKKDESETHENKLRKEEEKKSLLAKVINNKNFYLKEIEDLKESSLRITKLINNLEIQKNKVEKASVLSKAKFQSDQGGLNWPVNSRNILRKFGKNKHEKFNAFVFNKGIDIGVESKTNVFCIKAGKVVFADWFRGYGQMVMIDHDGGYYTLYSNLDHISTSNGSIVSKISPIGIIQDNSYLHFEIRINGNPVDPLLWLKE